MSGISDLDYFRAKINCAVSQIQARGLRISNANSYGVFRGPGNLWVADKGGEIWPTAVFLIGRPCRRYGECTEILEVLNVPGDYIAWFDDGFSGYNYSEAQIPLLHLYEAYKIGRDLLKSIKQ